MAQENFYTNIYPDIIDQWKFYIEKLDLKKGDKVLDIGCNSGDAERLMVNCSPQIEKVVGIDINKDKITEARNKIETSFQRNKIEFKTMDANNIKYENCYFDKIICAETIEWIEEPLKVLSEVKRVLKPNGIFILEHTDFDTQVFTTNRLDLTREIINKFSDIGPNGIIGRKLLGLCNKAGFEKVEPLIYTVINEKLNKSYYSYQIANMMKEWLIDQELIEEKKINDWLNDMKKIDEKGEFFYSINRNIVVCYK